MQSVVERGTILYLSMRMPRRLRLYDLAQDLYQIYAQVQHVKPLDDGLLEVGVCFLGKNPPPGYENYKAAEYLSTPLKQTAGPSAHKRPEKEKEPPTTWKPQETSFNMPSVGTGATAALARTTGPLSGKAVGEHKSSPREKRRDTRFQIPIDVSIAFLGTDGNADFQEPGLIIDISKHGACVVSTREAQVGDRLMITMMHEEFSARATVKAVNTGQGGVWNLHVEFLDKCWMGGSL